MTGAERRATVGLASIFALRMLGLFLVLPVFALYGDSLHGATPMLIGLAIGAYGLSQALLQIPLGIASDRWGRRPIIVAGLLLFAFGSVVAATSESIYGVILGRALQGSGAIAAAVMALASDLTRDSQRTKIMAVIGMSIGASFLVALVMGPLVAAQWGLAGVFWLTGVLALGGILLMYTIVPVPERQLPSSRQPLSRQFRQVLSNPNLWRLDLGIFVLHLILTATFVVLPIVLRDQLAVADAAHWQIYVPVLLVSVLFMVPILAFGERRRAMHRVLVYVVLALVIAQFGLAMSLALEPIWLLAALCLFFIAFNTLEASLPSLVSRYAPADVKGSALGVYSTSQFIGAFVGGIAGGAIYGMAGVEGVFAFCALAAIAWVGAAHGLTATPRPIEGGVSHEPKAS
jgi:MFS family permease